MSYGVFRRRFDPVLYRQSPFVPTKASSAQQVSSSDTFTPSESFLKQVNKLFADAIALSEGFAKGVNRSIAESVVLTESFAKQANKTVGDTVVLTEQLAAVKIAARAVRDTVSFSESGAK